MYICVIVIHGHIPCGSLFHERHRVGLRNEIVIDDDLATVLQARDGGLQDLDHIVIRPVVEDHPEQERVGLHGLILEEIMLLEFNSFGHVLRKGRSRIEHRPGKILDYEAKRGRRLRDDSADVSFRAANVDNKSGAMAQAGPRIVLRKQGWGYAWPIGESGHGAREAFGHRWVGGIIIVDWLIGLLCHSPSLLTVRSSDCDCALC